MTDPTPTPDAPAPDLRRCGYCATWHRAPCGDGCCWSPTDPTPDQFDAALRAERDEAQPVATRIRELELALQSIANRTYSNDGGCVLQAAAVAEIWRVAKEALAADAVRAITPRKGAPR